MHGSLRLSLCFAVVFGGIFGVAGGALAQERPSSRAELRNAAERWVARADSFRTRRAVEPALQAYRRARAYYRRLGDESRQAEMTGDMGVMYWVRSEYAAARRHFREALQEARAVGDREEVTSNLINLGLVQKNKGRYRKALRRYREALKILRETGDVAGRGVVLNNLGEIYSQRGQLRAAQPALRESLRIHRARDDSLRIATNLLNLGGVLRQRGKHEKALGRHREALAINRAIGNRDGTADALQRLGQVQARRDRSKAAMERYRQSLEIWQELGRRAEVAQTRNTLGAVLETQGKTEAALALYQQALDTNLEYGHRVRVSQNLSNIGHVQLKTGRLAAADSSLRASVRIMEALLGTTTGADRRGSLDQEVARFHALVTTQVRRGRPDSALRVLERSRAQVLTERLGGEQALLHASSRIPPVDSLQRVLDRGEAAVLYANASTDRPVVAIVVTREAVRAHEVTRFARVRDAVETYQDAILRLRRSTELGRVKGGAVQQSTASRTPGRLDGRDDRLADLVHLYRHDLAVPSARQVMSSRRRERLGRYLYNLLLAPLEEDLTGVNELIVVPDGALGSLPFGTLQDWSGERLLERTRVRYAQSLHMLRLLARRDQERTTPAPDSLLALGGAAYGTAAPTEPALAQRRQIPAGGSAGVDSAGAVAPPLADTRAGHTSRSLERGTETGSVYARRGSRARQWADLPGSRREVEGIQDIAPSTTLLTGDRVSERTLRRWSRTDRLGRYRVLHMAVHGVALPHRPSRSALVLSDVRRASAQAGAPPASASHPGRLDGYLSAPEIARLDLNADLVTLSACRSGLGRTYRGSGVLSLTQSFLEAGAGATAVSLWAVYDTATSRFMQAVYRRAWRRETTWAEALVQTKRAFAAGKYGTRLQDPRFWAPFVHYGRASR